MKTVFAISLSILAFGIAQAQQVFGDETRAWMVGPAIAVSSGMVTDFQYSPSGTKLIYSRFDSKHVFQPDPAKPPGLNWFVYDIAKGNNIPLKINGLSDQATMMLLGDERTVFFVDNQNQKRQGFYNFETGATTPTAVPFDRITYFGDSPIAPFLLAITSDESLALIAPGRNVLTFRVPTGTRIQRPVYGDSQQVKFQAYAQEERSFRLREVSLSLRTGEAKVRDLSREEWNKLEPVEIRLPYDLAGGDSFSTLSVPSVAQEKGTPNSKRQPQKGYIDRGVIVCPTKFRAQMEPKGRSIAYVDNGALLLRDIRPFDHDLAEKMKIEALKAEALSQAKQVGLALMIYAADMDDVLPTGENFVGRLLPYLKNRQMLDGFNYTYSGGPVSQLKDPASTELGFTNGPGGRAVVYADGHAKWINDKP